MGRLRQILEVLLEVAASSVGLLDPISGEVLASEKQMTGIPGVEEATA